MKFKVGDFAISKVQSEAIKLYNHMFADTFCEEVTVLQIVEKFTTECPGGTQYSYRCRLASPQGIHKDYIIFNEIELDHVPEYNKNA